MTDKEYYIYHIPGKKIGCTSDLYERVTNQQGYETGEYEILYKTPNIDHASRMERILQKDYGYRVDLKPYNELSNNNFNLNNMKINVTEQTTTFPCPLNKLKGRLMDNLEMRWRTEHGDVYLDEGLAKWIVKNAKTSMFNNDRCYVYNKAMIKYLDYKRYENEIDELPFKEDFYEHEDDVVFYFDMIRDWAEERGIYANGDPKTQSLKLVEEVGETCRAILKQNKDDAMDGIGDCVVVLTNLAELLDTSIEECVERAYAEISNRTGKMKNGTFVKD